MSIPRFVPQHEMARRRDVRPDEEWRSGYGRPWHRYDYQNTQTGHDRSLLRSSDQWVEVRPKPVATERVTLYEALANQRKLREFPSGEWQPLGNAHVGDDDKVYLLSRGGRTLVGPDGDGYVEALMEDPF